MTAQPEHHDAPPLHADREFGERFGTHPYRSEWAQPDSPAPRRE